MEGEKVEEQPRNNGLGGITGKGFMPGKSGNPGGRPKGTSMKAFARAWLMAMTPEEKMKFLNDLDPQIVWRMSEGNPANDLNVDGEIRLPLYLPTELLEKYEITPKSELNSEEQK